MLVCVDQRNHTGCRSTHPNGTVTCPTCGHSLRYAIELHDIGTRVRHYEIVQVIGYGAFGAVYEAHDIEQPQTPVALKQTFDNSHIQSFAKEYATLEKLSHDNLPRYFDHFEEDGAGYLVMEYVPGQNLDDILNKRSAPLPESQVLSYAVQLCDALTYLHTQQPPIFHRDIKPGNIRLTPDGLIKLVDFGLLKEGNDFTGNSRLGLTPTYAPLEQYGGNTMRTDARTDVYSLGATLYHLLTNRKPDTATDRVSGNAADFRAPQDHNRNISTHVSSAVMRALNLKQGLRFASADEFRKALMGMEVPAPPPAGAASPTKSEHVRRGEPTRRTNGRGTPSSAGQATIVQREHSRPTINSEGQPTIIQREHSQPGRPKTTSRPTSRENSQPSSRSSASEHTVRGTRTARYCPTCKTKNELDELFCQNIECLAQLVPNQDCPKCGQHSVPVGARFCGQCGKPIPAVEA